jgi:hypothetical protein
MRMDHRDQPHDGAARARIVQRPRTCKSGEAGLLGSIIEVFCRRKRRFARRVAAGHGDAARKGRGSRTTPRSARCSARPSGLAAWTLRQLESHAAHFRGQLVADCGAKWSALPAPHRRVGRFPPGPQVEDVTGDGSFVTHEPCRILCSARSSW